MKYTAILLSGWLAICFGAFGNEVRVEDLPPVSSTQGWGTLQLGKSVDGNPLRIAGKEFSRGLGTHAVSMIVYDLDAGYTKFSAMVGVDEEMTGYTNSSVVFQVFGDDQKLFDSGVMRVNDAAMPVNVPVAGVKTLKLVVTDAGDGISCDHADWAEAVLHDDETTTAKAAKYFVNSPSLEIGLNEDGEIAGNFGGHTRLAGCRQEGAVAVKNLSGGGYEFTRTLMDAKKHRCMLTDRFTPTKDSVRWEIEIASQDAPWSTAIETQLEYPATKATRFWTSWGDPDNKTGAWCDPLEWRPFTGRRWNYQYGTYLDSYTAGQTQFCIPLFTIAEPEQDRAITVAQSPEDTLLDLTLATMADGGVSLVRKNYRLGEGKVLRFAMDLVGHPADPRAGLGWMVKRYPRFFNPGIPFADQLSGCAAYSGNEDPIDAGKFGEMAFAYNWKLSDDFPYMGNFIPVTSMDETWRRACAEPSPPGKPDTTSCRRLNDNGRWMKQHGFHVLSYFSVTEYGRNMSWPLKATPSLYAPDYWTNPTNYLIRNNLAASVLMNGGGPVCSNCYGALIMDPGDPGYRRHLVEQVRRNTDLEPDVDGICIDRTDWLNQYNPNADDGVSWVNGHPARSLYVSWKEFMKEAGPALHQAGKVVFLNNCTPRLEVVGLADGIYEEWSSPSYLNYAALTGVRKPVAIWSNDGDFNDAYFQRCLYLGIFPTAPYPSNNHCIGPSQAADDQLLTYGPLLNAIRGRKWVLAPHCVDTDTAGVKVNLFEVPGGYALPVSFGGAAKATTVRVRNIPGLAKLQCFALRPGTETVLPIASNARDGVLKLTIPLTRGCAVVQLTDKFTATP